VAPGRGGGPAKLENNMKIRPIVLDYETMPIGPAPEDRVPEPVSFSLYMPGARKPKFYAWGHKTGGNNCSKGDAARVLKELYSQLSEETPLLCHNAAFDTAVSERHFDLAVPHWRLFHDTMFLLFLDDPHQRLLGLKPSADHLLDMPPEERDAVKEWILTHKKQLEAEFPEIVDRFDGIKPSTAAAFIGYAPGNIVGPYADGDVIRTQKLFNLLHKVVTVDRGMGTPYDRERRVMEIFARNSREGIRMDRTKLLNDVEIYEGAQKKVDDWLRKALKAPDLDLDKDRQVADVLDATGQITEWTLTPTGEKSIAKKNMKLSHFKDRKVAAAYSYRQKCATMLQTFIRPWILYSGYDGWMRTTWNQVRQAGGDGGTNGTRTGRPSSKDPNFLNMPKPVEDNADRGFVMPTHIKGLPELPSVRRYILPDDKKSIIVRRDFNQQELRVLAHYEDGDLLRAYLANPLLDVHDFVRQQILNLLKLDLGRSITKQLNFGYIYGMGIPSLAGRLEKDLEEVKKLRKAQMTAVPGLKGLDDDLKGIGRSGEAIQTWGGRQYYVEPAKIINGILRSFEYKLLNYLIQGSSADITKESIIRYDEMRRDGRFILTVYDENVLSVPKGAAKKEALILREAMMSIELDVPLMSDCEIGPNYGDVVDLKEPKPDLSRWGITRY
jgi:DNA polymerase I-like protein with 3'-5' exonuclease and polymerase domains